MEEAVRLMATGEYNQAIAAFKNEIDRNPLNGWAYRYCAVCYLRSLQESVSFNVGTYHIDLMVAKEYMEKANELQPDTAEILSDMGYIESEMGNQEKALEYFNRSLSLNPENHITLARKATSLSKKEYYRESLQDIEHAIKLSFGEVPEYFKLAEWLKTQIILENTDNRKVAFKKKGKYK